MAKESKLTAQPRDVSGSAASRRMRRNGFIPGVINNGKCESMLIQLKQHDFEMMLHHHSSENLIFNINVDGEKSRKVLLNEVQHDQVTGDILHANFMEISMKTKMHIRIAVVLVGEPVGVLQDGGVLEHLLNENEIECLPGDLVETINVDVSKLKMGDTLTVGDIEVGSGLTVFTNKDIAVASVAAPRAEEKEVQPEETAEVAAGAEPELIGKEKEGAGSEAEKEEESKGEKGKTESNKEKSAHH